VRMPHRVAPAPVSMTVYRFSRLAWIPMQKKKANI